MIFQHFITGLQLTFFLEEGCGSLKSTLAFPAEDCHLLPVCFIRLGELYIKLRDQHIEGCEKFAQKILADATYHERSDLSKCRSHVFTWFAH